MKNKILLTTIGLGLLSALIGIIIVNLTSDYQIMDLGWNMFDYGIWVGLVSGFILLLINGTFIKTRFFKISQGFFALILIGAVLKILHWTTYSNLIMIIGIIGIIISYLLSFLKKPIKKRLDYIKLSWVIVGYTLSILSLMRIIRLELTELSNYILWLAIIEFSIIELKNKSHRTQKDNVHNG